MKIAYIGFDLFYDCLELIHNQGHEIIKIFTCPVDEPYESNSHVYSFAKQHNICITDEKITETMLREIEALGCELIVSAGYYYKIPTSNIPAVNIHPALLPVGRGGWPQPCVILKNLSYTGVTIHKIAKTFDSGDIIIQNKISVSDKENLETLTIKAVDEAVKLLNVFLADVKHYLDNAIPQAEGEYWKLPTTADMTFSISDDFDRIDRITRAFYGYKCYCRINEKIIEITKAKCVRSCENYNKNYALEYIIDGGKLLISELS